MEPVLSIPQVPFHVYCLTTLYDVGNCNHALIYCYTDAKRQHLFTYTVTQVVRTSVDRLSAYFCKTYHYVLPVLYLYAREKSLFLRNAPCTAVVMKNCVGLSISHVLFASLFITK